MLFEARSLQMVSAGDCADVTDFRYYVFDIAPCPCCILGAKELPGEFYIRVNDKETLSTGQCKCKIIKKNQEHPSISLKAH